MLENLSAQHPRLSTTLPGLRPRSFVARRGKGLAELPLTCDTLWIDTDRSICTLVWRGQLPLQHGLDEGRVYVLLEDAKAGRSPWADVERCCGDRSLGRQDADACGSPPIARRRLRQGCSLRSRPAPFTKALAAEAGARPGR